MSQALIKLCVLAVTLVACAKGSVPAQFADENEELYENPVENEFNIMGKRTRGLDPMAGITFGSIKKRIDTMRGGSFGSQKRAVSLLADIPSDQLSQSKILQSFIRKNIAVADREGGGGGADRPPMIASAFAGLPKKTPYPYYLRSIPMYLRVKGKGI